MRGRHGLGTLSSAATSATIAASSSGLGRPAHSAGQAPTEISSSNGPLAGAAGSAAAGGGAAAGQKQACGQYRSAVMSPTRCSAVISLGLFGTAADLGWRDRPTVPARPARPARQSGAAGPAARPPPPQARSPRQGRRQLQRRAAVRVRRWLHSGGPKSRGRPVGRSSRSAPAGPQGQGGVLAAKAVETQGKGGVLAAKAVETQGKGSESYQPNQQLPRIQLLHHLPTPPTVHLVSEPSAHSSQEPDALRHQLQNPAGTPRRSRQRWPRSAWQVGSAPHSSSTHSPPGPAPAPL